MSEALRDDAETYFEREEFNFSDFVRVVGLPTSEKGFLIPDKDMGKVVSSQIASRIMKHVWKL